MPTRCCQCGVRFEADQPGKTRCLPCWRRSQGLSSLPRETEQQRAERRQIIHDLRRLCLHLQSDNAGLRARLEYAPHRGIPPNLKRFIAQKCHPDRCQDQATATEVLQWLNTQ